MRKATRGRVIEAIPIYQTKQTKFGPVKALVGHKQVKGVNFPKHSRAFSEEEKDIRRRLKSIRKELRGIVTGDEQTTAGSVEDLRAEQIALGTKLSSIVNPAQTTT